MTALRGVKQHLKCLEQRDTLRVIHLLLLPTIWNVFYTATRSDQKYNLKMKLSCHFKSLLVGLIHNFVYEWIIWKVLKIGQRKRILKIPIGYRSWTRRFWISMAPVLIWQEVWGKYGAYSNLNNRFMDTYGPYIDINKRFRISMAPILIPAKSLGRSKGPVVIQTSGKSIYSNLKYRNIYKRLDAERLVGKVLWQTSHLCYSCIGWHRQQ